MKRLIAIFCIICILLTSVNVVFAEDGQENTVSGNIFLNPGFEDSSSSPVPWTKNNGIATNVKRSGNNSLLLNIGSAPDKCEQTVMLQPGKTYVWSVWVKADSADSTITLWEVGDANLFEHNWITVSSNNPNTEDGWTELKQVFTTPLGWSAEKEYKMAFLCQNAGTSIYVDDCYLGILAVNDIEILGQEKLYIPQNGENTTKYTAKLLDQFGTAVDGGTVEWSLYGEHDGVTIDSQSGVLTVSSFAAEGVVTILVTADGVQKTLDVTLENESEIPITDENLFSDCGFENGATGWEAYNSITDAIAKAGNKSAYVAIGSASQKVRQTVNLQKDKIYIVSGYVFPEDGHEGNTVQIYAESRCNDRLEKYQDSQTVNAVLDESSWKQATRMYSTKNWSSSGDAAFGVLSERTNFYVDEMYLGELVLKEIKISGNEEFPIPFSGTSRATYKAELLNQLENNMGLSGETVTWSLENEYDGVSIDSATGVLQVDSSVSEGVVNIQASCVPEFNTQGEVMGTYSVMLTKEPLTADVVKKNMFTNGGFENGISGWSGVSEVSEDKFFEGSKSGKLVYGKSTSIKANQTVTLEPNAVYIMYAQVRGEEGNNGIALQLYAENRSSNSALTSNSSDSGYNKNATVVENDWTQAVRIYKTDLWTESGDVSFGALSSDNLICYIDDFYVGRLVIDSFGIRGYDSVQIPKGNNVSKATYTATLTNQAGTTMGVGAERVIWELGEEYDGVSIDANTGILSVTSEAPAGAVKVRATCYPSFNTDVLSKLYEDKTVMLTSDAGPEPVIKGLKVVGAVEANAVLTASYRFYQKDGNEDASEYQWYRALSADGEYTKIEGANGASYIVGSEEDGYVFAVEITPKDNRGNVGEPVMSLPAVKPTAPIAQIVSVEGKAYEGATVAARYDFYDANGDEEGETEFCWYRGEDEDSLELIPGAEGKEYTLTREDSGKYIAVGITAVSRVAPYKNDEGVISECVYGPVAPVATKVSIKGDVTEGETVVAEYTYTHPYGLPENETKFKWIMDGNTVGTGASYQIPSGAAGGRLVLEVTAGCKFAPHYGEAVESKTVSIAKRKSSWGSTVSGGSGGSGGFGGGGSSMGTNNSGMNSGIVVQPTSRFSDTTNHWAKNEIEKMADAGVVSGVGGGIFEPDRTVSRAEFVAMISRVLELSNDDETAVFTDVNSADWYFDAVQAAYKAEVINGYGDEFRPLATITREEAAKVIVNVYEKYIGEAQKGNITFGDKEQISDWALDAVEKAVGSSLLNGDDANLIKPQGNLSRAEAACVLYRLYNILNGGVGK